MHKKALSERKDRTREALKNAVLAYLANPARGKSSLTEEHYKILRGLRVRPIVKMANMDDVRCGSGVNQADTP